MQFTKKIFEKHRVVLGGEYRDNFRQDLGNYDEEVYLDEERDYLEAHERLFLTGYHDRKKTWSFQEGRVSKPSITATLEGDKRFRFVARAEDGTEVGFKARVRIDTPVEVDYYRNGGILHTVLRRLRREG